MAKPVNVNRQIKRAARQKAVRERLRASARERRLGDRRLIDPERAAAAFDRSKAPVIGPNGPALVSADQPARKRRRLAGPTRASELRAAGLGKRAARRTARQVRRGRLTGRRASEAAMAGVDASALMAESERRSGLGLGLGLRPGQRERFRADPAAFLSQRRKMARKLGRQAYQAIIQPESRRATAFGRLGLDPRATMAQFASRRFQARRPVPSLGGYVPGAGQPITESPGFGTPGVVTAAPPISPTPTGGPGQLPY